MGRGSGWGGLRDPCRAGGESTPTQTLPHQGGGLNWPSLSPISHQPELAGEAAQSEAVLAGETVAKREPAGDRPDRHVEGEADRSARQIFDQSHQGDAGEGDAEALGELVTERRQPVADPELDRGG